MKPLVFLHIPKTAGQTIHTALADMVGPDNVSPVRVHSQVDKGASQLPPGYALYSGHIDWTDLESLPADRFVFTVLRDPLERIASFYFYLLDQAAGLSPDALAEKRRTGMRMVLTHTADDYFFGGDATWQKFIHDHYDNFYCSYFATRRMRGHRQIARLTPDALLDRALTQSRALNRIYATTALGALEADIAAEFGSAVHVTGRYVNAGRTDRQQARWPQLAARLERDASIARLEQFAALDRRLMDRLGLPPAAPVAA